MNIIEIGANDGGNTNRFWKNSNVWCFEPNPHYAKLLGSLFVNNTNIKIIQKAVSNYNGKAYFYISVDGASSSLNNLTQFAINNTGIRYVDRVIVDVIRMDSFLTDTNIDVIDYFHCDAQGEDFNILKSFGDMIHIIQKGKIEVSLKDELYSNISNNVNEVADFLNDKGFEILNWREINENKMDIYRYDGNLQFCKKNNKQLI
jgi:FkbM family methyltransferase